MDPSRIVRSGYDAIAGRYLDARLRGIDQLPVLRDFIRAVPKAASILDAGCGAGLPITGHLASSFHVLGVDFSLAQLRLARELVPNACFACQDLAALGLATACVDGVCSFYSIIHIPRSLHLRVLRNLYRVLRPEGIALLCLGAEDLPEEVGEYQGVPMFWSHFDANTYLEMLADIGFVAIRNDLISDPIDATGRHLFVFARKPGA
jgi:SAM-dependent methyltransferase